MDRMAPVIGGYVCRHAEFVIAAKLLNGFGGRLRSFKLGGTIGCCAPNPHANVGSLESSSRVTKFGLGDATGENVGISLVWVPESSVEFTKSGELFRCGLGSFESCSTKNISESIEIIEILEAIFKL